MAPNARIENLPELTTVVSFHTVSDLQRFVSLVRGTSVFIAIYRTVTTAGPNYEYCSRSDIENSGGRLSGERKNPTGNFADYY